MKKSHDQANPRWSLGLLISAGIIAVGIVLSVFLRETGGSETAALVAAIACNLTGALVLDFFTRRDGAVVGSMAVLMLLSALPLLWVPDRPAWIRENPLTFGFILLLGTYMRQKMHRSWPLYAVAIILGGAHILISLF